MEARKEEALALLLSGLNNAQTAKQIGVNRVTVGRWIKDDPEFAAALDPELAEKARGGLRELVPQALKILEDALTPGGNVTAARAKVALDVIKTASSISTSEEKITGTLAARLAEIGTRDNMSD